MENALSPLRHQLLRVCRAIERMQPRIIRQLSSPRLLRCWARTLAPLHCTCIRTQPAPIRAGQRVMSSFLLARGSLGPADGDAPSPAEPAKRQSSDSEPDWLRHFTPKAAAVSALPSSSSSDDDDAAPAAPPPTGAAAKPAEAPARAAAKPAAASHPAADPASHAAGAPPSALPLVFADRLAKAKVLVELEGEGDAVDLEGDVGAVGRFYSRPSEDAGPDELRLDLKGVIYEARMLPSTTCMVIRIERGEAKARAISWQTDLLS